MFKRDGKWWVSITFQGKRIRRSTETSSLELAKAVEAKLRTELIEGKYFDKYEGERRTFQQLMQRFMKEHAPKVSENTRVLYAASLKHLSDFFGDALLSEITSKKINDYKQARKKAGGGAPSINRSLSMLSKAFNLCVKEWEWVRENPVLKVSRERENAGRDRWLANEDEKMLLDHAPQWLKEIVVFDLHTGLRQDELLSLEWNRVNLFNKTILIQETKNGKPRTIPLNQVALEILVEKSRIRNLKSDLVFQNSTASKIDRNNLRRAFNTALKRAGIQDFHFHDLRHSFATRLAQRGVDIYKISKLLGHAHISMSAMYAHHCPDSLRDGVSILENSGHDLVTLGESRKVSMA